MTSTPRKVLAVGAHPDDIELGCLGTLMRWQTSTRAVVLSGSKERVRESRSALKRAGFGDLHAYDLKDCGLSYSLRAATDIIEAHIDEFDPDVILTQTRWDTHPDHRAVCDSVFSAARRRPISIYGYHIISSTQAFPVNMIVDVTTVLDRKLASLACHKSQAGKCYFDPSWLVEWHREKTATSVGIAAAELFHVFQTFQ